MSVFRSEGSCCDRNHSFLPRVTRSPPTPLQEQDCGRTSTSINPSITTQKIRSEEVHSIRLVSMMNLETEYLKDLVNSNKMYKRTDTRTDMNFASIEKVRI